MIPYLPPPEIAVGPLRLHLFGLLVGFGVGLGYLVALRVAPRAGLAAREVRRAALWALLPGFLGAALFRVLVYAPQELAQRGPLALVDFGHGMSSFGGFLFAALGVALFARLRERSFLRLADVLVQGLAVGWVCGRLGCTFAHDHVGIASDFALAVAYPGGARHNLGLYEFLATAGLLVPLLVVLQRRARYFPGLFVAAVSLFYGPLRFALDYLRVRAAEGLIGPFTVAQYLALALAAVGALALARRGRSTA